MPRVNRDQVRQRRDMTERQKNRFTEGPLGAIHLKTALPIIFVMCMNGLLSVTDAVFLGHYVGPEALAAVTLMFPFYMLIVALSTLVANAMSSLLARSLGAHDLQNARTIFSGAHGLALDLGLILILVFAVFGQPVTLMIAAGTRPFAEMGLVYMQITVLFCPLLF